MTFNINLEKYIFPFPVKILMFVGNYTDPNLAINTTVDKNLIENLPGARPIIVDVTSTADVINALDNNEFDILFFAGHSNTLPDGVDTKIWINDTIYITINQIQVQIRNALNRNNHPLVLAIFNSCDGLGIDQQLTALNMKIPYLIAMREPISDEVAHQFLELLLRYFVKNKMSLQSAYQQARQVLKGFFPNSNTDFLPILCTKQAMMPDLFWPHSIVTFISELWRNLWLWYKKHRTIVYVTLAMMALVAVVMLAWIFSKQNVNVLKPTPTPIAQINNSSSSSSSSFSSSTSFEKNDYLEEPCKSTELAISCGEKSLFDDNTSGDKERGLEAFNKKEYDGENGAIKKLENAFQQNQQDYETGIFLENAKVLSQEKAKKQLQIFAVSVVIPTIDQGKKAIYSVSKAVLQGVYNQQKYFNNDNNKNQLLVVIANDNNDSGPEPKKGQKKEDGQAQKVAKELANRNIYAVIGPYSSKVAYYTKSIYQDQKIVVMSYANTATNTTYEKNNTKITLNLTENSPFYFRVCSKNTEITKILAQYFDKQKYDNVILFYHGEDIFSVSFRQDFNKYWTSKDKNENFNMDQKNKIIAEDSLRNIDRKKINAKLNDAQKQNLSVLLCPGAYTKVNKSTNSEETDVINTKYIIENYTEKLLIGGCNVVDTYEESIKDATNKKNIVVAVPWFYNPNSTQTNEFTQWEEIWKTEQVNYQKDSFMRMVLAQDATMVIADALSKLDGEPSRSKLQQYLANPEHKFSGITGEISFKGSDRNLDTSVLITPKCETKECNNWNGEWEIVK